MPFLSSSLAAGLRRVPMLGPVARAVAGYTHWLHTRWPAGTVEKLPVVLDGGSTNVAGLYVVGDLTGVPLLKFSADTGTRAVRRITEESAFEKRATDDPGVLDVAIVGGGVSGFAAAKECERRGLRYRLFEASEPFSTIVNFPVQKPIYTYPTDLTPEGDLQFHEKSEVREGLLEDLREQTLEAGIEPTFARVEAVKRRGGVFELEIPEAAPDVPRRAHRVIVAIGRSGNFRKLDVPGEELDKVSNRLHDPKDLCGQRVLVVGGGDSACETAIALATCGADVTLSYRRGELSRPKPENVAKVHALAEGSSESVEVETVDGDRVTTPSGEFLGSEGRGTLRLMLGSEVERIREDAVEIRDGDGDVHTLGNDAVFAMIGREAPLDFFRRSGVRIAGERDLGWWATLAAFFAFCFWLYHWKGEKEIPFLGRLPEWLVFDTRSWIAGLQESLGGWAVDPAHPLGVLMSSARGPSFWYTLAYSIVIVIFGWRRIRRRKTPYVKWQTVTLASVQIVPLFLIPELFLPWFHGLGWFESGFGAWIAGTFFPGQSWWRAYGLILAWPLFVYNFFTDQPIWGWIVLGSLQTFVLLPLAIRVWGKGVYCGWICSCGALAETLGDQHRHKMPHGPGWNRLNMLGQGILLAAVVLMGLRVTAWATAPSLRSGYFSAWSFDETTGRTEGAVYNLDPATVDAHRWIDGPEGPLEIVEVSDETDEHGGVRVVVDGDLSGFGDNTGLASVVPGATYRVSSAVFEEGFKKVPFFNYQWFVDVLLAGILGYGLYFHFSGRMWCRFACPLAALMHIYARFSRFAILAEKKKCISCNVCTSVCHQGIDIMNFANKGLPMQDPECVRCSACVQSCPTGVLSFGQVDSDLVQIGSDPAWLAASPVRIAERNEG